MATNQNQAKQINQPLNQKQIQQINNVISAQQAAAKAAQIAAQAQQASKPNTISTRARATVEAHQEQRTVSNPVKRTVKRFGRV